MSPKYSLIWKVGLIGLISIAYAKSPTHLSLLKDIESKNVFVTYYSPHRHFLKLWKTVDTQNLPTLGGGFVSHLIDCKEETDLCIEQKVKFYPSIRFHQSGSGQPQIFQGRRTVSALLSFLGKAMLGASANSVDAGVPEDAKSSPPVMTDGVMELTDANFDTLTVGGPVFVKFYTDWCPHCKQLRPLFPQLAQVAKQLGVALAEVNCESQADTCSRQAVPHYPFLALHGRGRRLAVHEADNSIEAWQQFLQLQLQRLLNDRVAAASEGVLENWFSVTRPVSLGGDNFESTAKSTEFLFVKFFAPWCSHCKRLAPVWELLAHVLSQEFPGRGQLALGRVDCTQEAALCTQQGVRAYPSLMLYRRGQLVDSFRGMRDLAALADFVRAAVGLHSKEPRDEL